MDQKTTLFAFFNSWTPPLTLYNADLLCFAQFGVKKMAGPFVDKPIKCLEQRLAILRKIEMPAYAWEVWLETVN